MRLGTHFSAHGLEPDALVLGGRFKILRTLGAGGMGVVYLAEQVSLGRRVALKVLHPGVHAQPEMVERFRSEARLLSSVEHPGVVRVIDYGQEGDVGVLVMEFAEGQPLDQLLKKHGRLEVARAVPLLIQLAEGLGAIHAAGIVHRDIKPENVMLGRGPSGESARLLDFGVARLVDGSGGQQTQVNKVHATLPYMSPERATGSPPDPRSDLYSFGVLAYRMVTDRLPFEGPTLQDYVDQHTRVPPPRPESILPELATHRALCAVLMCLLEKDPKQRFFSARALAEALRRLTETERSVTPLDLQAYLPSEPQVIDDLPPETPQVIDDLLPEHRAEPGELLGGDDVEEALKTTIEGVPAGAPDELPTDHEGVAALHEDDPRRTNAGGVTADDGAVRVSPAARLRAAATGTREQADRAWNAARPHLDTGARGAQSFGRALSVALLAVLGFASGVALGTWRGLLACWAWLAPRVAAAARSLRTLVFSAARVASAGFHSIPLAARWVSVVLALAAITIWLYGRPGAAVEDRARDALDRGQVADALAMLQPDAGVESGEAKRLRVRALHAAGRHQDELVLLATMDAASLAESIASALPALAEDFAADPESETLREQLARFPVASLEQTFASLALRPATAAQWGALQYLDQIVRSEALDRSLGYALALGSPDCKIRQLAAQRLSEVGDPQAVPALSSIAGTDPPEKDDCGRSAAVKALKAIRERSSTASPPQP